VYWIFALSLCILIIGYKGDWHEAIFLTLVFSPIPIGSAYLITYYLLEEFLLKQRYIRFFVFMVYILIASLYTATLINSAIFIFVADYKFYRMPPATRDLLTLTAILFLLVILFVAIQSIRKWSQTIQEKERALKNVAEAELRFLKTQLHPHFLFNTLNNLYALTLQKSEKAPELVLKLSSLLDYILHVEKNELVNIQSEIAIMNDFIYLESMRYEDRLILTKSIDLNASDPIRIPSLVLITIVENCFKHAAMNNAGQVVIRLKVKGENGMLLIEAQNSFNPNKEMNKTGIGLENIRKQFYYFYGSDFSMDSSIDKNLYNLKIVLPAHASF
ncbi:MAG: histidine kinase, partial [Cyclobacteriaceae bacterium]|nr:histidine kinase [Cyclobacteriaceae bacterium]